MNKKAQSIITLFFWVVIFIIGFAMFFGKWINDTAEQAITTTGMTGFEAFIFANLNIIIIIALLFFILVYMYMGGER